MKPKFLSGIFVAACLQGAGAQLVINEVDSDTPGSDTAEFVEIFDGGAGNTSLDGHALVFFNGSDDTPYLVVDLTGQTTGGDGFFVYGNPGVANVDLTVDPGGSGAIQNGADSVALYNGQSAIDFLTEPPTLVSPTTADLIDAVVYDTNDADDSGLLTGLGETIQWDENGNGNKDNESIQLIPGQTDYILALPTPGAANVEPVQLSLSLDPTSISEGDSFGASTGTVSIPSALGEDLIISISSSDETEAIPETSATIGTGSTSATFAIDAVDDLVVDGTQTVVITVSASGNLPATAELDVTDDDTSSLVVFNEVYYGDSLTGDANGDLTVDEADEFIEIVNVSGSTLDLSGYHLEDDAGTTFDADGLHRFRDGTVLEPGCAIVVFGGGVADGTSAAFGSTQVVSSSIGDNTLHLGTNGSEVITLFDELDNEIASLTLPVPANGTDSLNLSPDTVPGTYAAHSAVTGAVGAFSPGTMVDGTPFCVVTDSLAISSVSPASVSEEVGTGASVVTVTLPAAAAADVAVTLISSNPSKIVVNDGFGGLSEATLVIPSGSTQAMFTLDTVNNSTADGTVTVDLTALASGYLNAASSIEVTDPVDMGSSNDIVFTQYYEGDTGVNKHVEITNTGTSEISLDGWLLTLWTNANAENWKTATGGASSSFSLTGTSLSAGQTIVISNGSSTIPSITPTLTSSTVNFNGNDSMVLYSGVIDPANIVDALSFTNSGNEGANKSFVRQSSGTGWSTAAGSNITEFPSVWAVVDLRTVDAAMAGDTNYLGSYGAGSTPYSVAISAIAVSGGQVTLTFTASGSSDIYVSTDLQTWTLATSGGGVASGTYTDTTPPAGGKAFYLIQEAGAPAP